jgi:hypothetical protein
MDSDNPKRRNCNAREVSLGDHKFVGDPMRHFNLQNLHEITDANLDMWTTVLSSDSETFSELSRNRFHLVDMSGEVWTIRRAA